jgi:hypothetical protein
MAAVKNNGGQFCVRRKSRRFAGRSGQNGQHGAVCIPVEEKIGAKIKVGRKNASKKKCVRIPVKMARLLSVFVVNLLLFHSKV